VEALVGSLCRKGPRGIPPSSSWQRGASSLAFTVHPNANTLNKCAASKRSISSTTTRFGYYSSNFDRHYGISSIKGASPTYSTYIGGDGAADDSSSTSSSNQKSCTSLHSAIPISEYELPPPIDDVLSIQELKKGQRVVSFGDVHGDIDALVSFLVTAKLMDGSSTAENPIWCGGDSICVQTGDVLDRGDDELACLRLLASLSRQAQEAGGSLTLLYGNHEAINSIGLFQYANPGGNAEFEVDIGKPIDELMGNNRWRLQFAGNQPSRWAAMEPGGLLAESLLKNMKVAVVVGRTVFVHAGLTKEHLRDYGGVEGMNRAAKDWITQVHHGENNNDGEYDTVEEVLEAAQRRAKAAAATMPECLGGGIGSASPVWMRDYSNPSDNEPKVYAQTMIDEALQELGGGVQRMVMGHTPQYRINAALKGKAWRVDVGASRGVMNGTPEVLEIIHGGEDEEDVVNILTMGGDCICSSDRQVMPVAGFF